jgi:anthranilate synthase/aminodeoxychorismate synthase-like glutamine amidotransferase
VAILFAENEDSFSWNVVERLPLPRSQIRICDGRELAARPTLLDGAWALVIGPGPTDPERAGIVELVREAARRRLPTLGICLGFQAIGLAFGARLVRVQPAHGRVATVHFDPSRSFPGIEGPCEVMRYHSLALAGIGSPLRSLAATGDGIPMALEHERLPMAGLQFHPDSHGTPRGEEMLAAFFRGVA